MKRKGIIETIKKYLAVSKAIDEAKGSWNDLSLTSVRTSSLTDLQRNFDRLKNEGIISEKEYDAIFSTPVIKELRPYKGTLQSLSDTDMGIVSKDYFSDIVAYIIGIRLTTASSSKAWENAKKLVESLGLETDMLDINEQIPAEIFTANNMLFILETQINNKYHTCGLPVKIISEYPDGNKYENVCIVERYIPEDVNITPKYVHDRLDEYIDEYRNRSELSWEESSKKFGGVFDRTTLKLIKACLEQHSLDELDLSSELSESGRENQLTTITEKIVFDEYENYRDFM